MGDTSMNEDRKRILNMLAEGKITAEEAERLIAALEGVPVGALPGFLQGSAKRSPKFLRVEVDARGDEGGPTKVNIRVPMTLLRAGVRLSALIPPATRSMRRWPGRVSPSTSTS